MTSDKNINDLKPFEARSVIEDLRKGSVPINHVPFFTVGRKKWLTSIGDDLEQYIAEGGAKVRFINGDYGDGKTHFMSIIRHLSLQKGFAVSFVVLTRDVPVHKFEVVYRELVRQLCGSFEGAGLRSLIDQWAESLKDNLTDNGESSLQEKLNQFRDTMRAISGMDLNFANALISLVENRFLPLAEGETKKERSEAFETLCQWFEGGKISKRELKPFQIFESLNKTNSKLFLNSLIAFLRYVGYKGLILLIDELETIIPQSASVRNAGYENVRLLIDNTEQAQFFYIFFSIIPDVLLSEKGFKSYDALWSRIRSVGESKGLNYRGVLVNLHRTPLKPDELIELGISLRHIHEIAYRWDSKDLITDELIKKICEAQQRMGLLSEVRLYIKQIIRYLDMAEQGESPDSDELLTEQIVIAQKELEEEKTEHLQPDWDS
ncbi:MAG: BREX system ATP-binding domain-containing protein [Nitrospirota bacterium]